MDRGVDANGVVETVVVRRKARLPAVRMSNAAFKVCIMGGIFNAIKNLSIVRNRAQVEKAETSG